METYLVNSINNNDMQVKVMHGSSESKGQMIFNEFLDENGSQYQLQFPEGPFWISKDAVWVRRNENYNWESGSKYKYDEQGSIQANVLLDDMYQTFQNCMETAIRKNNDYGGSNNNPFANFENSTVAGVPVERGILVRLMDKMSRISTLLDKEAMVKDEAITDTIEDAINYLAILKSYINQKNK
jgi:hypothetical protein